MNDSFQNENYILEKYESNLKKNISFDSLKKEYMNLFKEYKQLIKQTKKSKK
ncbi:hypothetical protein [Marinitoga lauensis]|uniref:hypothetical protein n=1 Tax=Marinitoga lauensis TaxID=2201189 RepID=UPI0014055DA6|nr:hypothetical protein [Marinitoga lauensis]